MLRGRRALAVDLPGHGFDATIPDGYLGDQNLSTLATAPSGMAGISTADDVALVSDVVRRAAQHGPGILIGHSRSYIRLTEDRAFPLAMQDRLIREADGLTPDSPFDVHSVASSHIGFQLHPAEAVTILDRLATTARV